MIVHGIPNTEYGDWIHSMEWIRLDEWFSAIYLDVQIVISIVIVVVQPIYLIISDFMRDTTISMN